MKEIIEIFKNIGLTKEQSKEAIEQFEKLLLDHETQYTKEIAAQIVQEFEITRNVDWYDTPISVPVHKFDIENLVDGDAIITKRKNIIINFNYPLTQAVNLIYSNNEGFTRKDIYKCIHEGYTQIYSMEEDPGQVSKHCINRSQSAGPIGIWGHYIGDLVIEGVTEQRPGYFTLSIGS